jgi:hypothetical protein
MRKLLFSAVAMLPACATAPAQPVAPVPALEGICRADTLSQFVGQSRSAALEARLLAASGARLVRWVTPDMMITMDHREDRLTVRLGTDNRIGSLSCG